MRSAAKIIASVLALYCGGLLVAAQAGAIKPLKAGQYEIGSNPVIQEICLKDDGTWYGTTFNFNGHWVNHPFNLSRVAAAIYGSYQVQGHNENGFGNSARTSSKPTHSPEAMVDWYDWFDDLSHSTYLTAIGVAYLNKKCAPPFKGENTHAATD